MKTRPSRSIALVARLGLSVLAMSACASRTDERVREAWGGSPQTPGGARGRVGPLDRDGSPEDPSAVPVRVGWDRVDEIVDAALAEASLGTDEEVMARLAKRWCKVEPVPLGVGDERRRVCTPDPPLQIDGHTFILELGGEGVIGLVAIELSADESARLAEEARRRTERWCTRPWTDVSPHSTEISPPATAVQLHTCAVEGSAMLVVGSFVSAPGEDWQFSVAVIDAS